MNARWAVAIVATAAVVWLNSPELAWPARLWTTALLALLPPAMVFQAQQLRGVDVLPRHAAYISSMVSLWILAAATVGVAAAAGMPPAALGFAPVAVLPLLLWTAALTAAGISIILLFHLAGYRDPDIVRQLLPATRRDRTLFLGVSVTAGVCEEIVFRGFLLYALLHATGSLALAVLLSSGVFGVVHAYQQAPGALRAALIGAVLALPLLLTGSIYPAILAHALVDIISGFWLSRLLLR